MNLHKHKAAVVIALVLLLQTVLLTGYLTQSDEAQPLIIQENTTQPRTINIIEAAGVKTLTTSAATVKQALDELQIKMGPQDRVEPGLEEAVADSIKITRVETKKITKEQTINYSIEKKNDAELFRGEERIIQKGIKGLEKLVYEVVFEDNREVGKTLLEKIVVKAPVTQIVATGNRQSASRGGQSIEFDRMIKMSATGYTETGNKTYTGVWPGIGTVAVDPKVIPLGTKLYIDGYGFARALDIGGAIKGNRIDLFFATRAEALKWGRRSVQVFVLK